LPFFDILLLLIAATAASTANRTYDRSLANNNASGEQDHEGVKRRFITLGSFKSRDQKNPDVIEAIATEKETFETEYSACINVQDKDGNARILPLKSHNSRNVSLSQKWTSCTKSGKIKKGKKVTIRTWLDTSKNGNPIRRFTLVL
jgi:hypothetical protein